MICLGLLLAALAGSCGTGQPAGQSHPDEAAVQDALPGLATLRGSSAAGSLELLGNANFSHSLNTVQIGDNVTLLSSPTEPSWAIYQFNPGLAYLEEIQVLLANVNDAALLAVSDYASGRWQFHGPYTGSTTLPLTDATMRSDGGSFHIAVLTAGGDEAQVQKLVLHTETHWRIVTVASAGDVGRYSSLVETPNGPAIACFDETQDDLLFVHSGTANGLPLAAWTVERIDTGGNVGQYCSLAMVGGNPAISYYDQTNRALKFARSTTTIGADAATWRIKTVDDGLDEVGAFTSLAVIDGRPAISYYNSTDTDLMYAISANATGTEAPAIWLKVKVDQNAGVVGLGTSLALVNGKPQIAYYEFFPYRLHYAISRTVNGDNHADWDYYTATAIEPVGGNFDLLEVAGKPLVSFYDWDGGSLRLLRSSEAEPASAGSWNSSVTVAGGGGFPEDRGDYSSLALIDGRPSLAYHDYEHSALRFAHSSSLTGASASDWRSIEVDSGNSVGEHCSLALINGQPAISYYDSTDHDLRYAILQPPGS